MVFTADILAVAVVVMTLGFNFLQNIVRLYCCVMSQQSVVKSVLHILQDADDASLGLKLLMTIVGRYQCAVCRHITSNQWR